jgi:hypothetical protein
MGDDEGADVGLDTIDVTSFEGGGEGSGSFGYDADYGGSGGGGGGDGGGPGGGADAPAGQESTVSMANQAISLMKDMGILRPGDSLNDMLSLVQNIQTQPGFQLPHPDPYGVAFAPALYSLLGQFSQQTGNNLYNPGLFGITNPSLFTPTTIDPLTGLPVDKGVNPTNPYVDALGRNTGWDLAYNPDTLAVTAVDRGPDLGTLTGPTVAGTTTTTPSGTPGGTPTGPTVDTTTGTPTGPTTTVDTTTGTGTPTVDQTTGAIDYSSPDLSGFDAKYRDLLKNMGLLPGGPAVAPPASPNPPDMNAALRDLVSAAGVGTGAGAAGVGGAAAPYMSGGINWGTTNQAEG